ncbi:MAG: DEAD/DEAH box helicase family protein [Candidatus Riflebacteria bacterium]|nr:DEAD/DEAH box helicase family protein [Candidatus Riflebacteria bacterium]
MILRPYQELALEALEKKYSEGARSLILWAPTGAGKTVMAGSAIKTALHKGKFVLFLAHRKELIDQCAKKIDALGLPYGIVMAGYEPDTTAPIQIASIQTLARREMPFAPDMIVIDECFPAGTFVDGKPIENICIGDYVRSYNHNLKSIEFKRVTHVFKKISNSLVKVKLSNGKAIISTSNHPFFTIDGYKPATDLSSKDYILKLNLEANNANSAMFDLWKRKRSDKSFQTKRTNQERLLYLFSCVSKGFKFNYNGKYKQEICFKSNEKKESDVGCRNKRKGFSDTSRNELATSYTGWKWKRASRGTTHINRYSGLENGTCNTNKNEAWDRFSNMLQGGYWKSELENCNRNRWCESLQLRKAKTGQKENRLFEFIRVEGVEIFQSASDIRSGSLHQDGFVYNLEVEGNNNYFANDILVHNCHHAAAATYKKFIDSAPDAQILGLTATPFRADGKGLGEIFQDWVLASSVSELTQNGYLAPARYWAPSMPDLAGIKRKAGDFDTGELAERLGKPKLIGDIITHYKSIAGGKKAILFAVNKEHSQTIADAFNQAGIKAAHLSDDTGKRDRANILSDHMAGRITVLTNVNILSEGYDSPTVEVCIQARPTLSLGLHIQQIGRVLRPCSSKNCAFIIDHAGNVRRHGLATDPLSVDLSVGETKTREKKDDAPALRTCSKCYAILPASMRECPNCAVKLGSPPKTIINKDGTLQELTKTVCECGSFTTIKEPHPVYGYCLYCSECKNFIRPLGREIDPVEYYLKKLRECREKGYKDSRAGILFKVRFQRWPDESEQKAAKAQLEQDSELEEAA